MRNQPIANTVKSNSLVSHIASSIEVATRYIVNANIAYSPIHSDVKLDLYQPSDPDERRPTLMFIHGGGWSAGSKETSTLWLLPFLQLGWTVLNVGYRLLNTSPAPAAVNDCVHALSWVRRNAGRYNINLTQLVLAGYSAGGHLALATAMIPACLAANKTDNADELGIFPAELLKQFRDFPTPAAVINWCGITDVTDLLAPPNLQDYAVQWLGTQPNKIHIARCVSPINYVRPGLSPVVTIHGDRDLAVPYSHAVRLHQALSSVEVPNKLITLPGAGHILGVHEKLEAYRLLLIFLEQLGIRIASL